MIFANRIVVLLSGNGMKVYFPLLSFLSKKCHKKIFHDVIGGNIDKYVRNIHQFGNYLNSFEVNWVETENLRRELETVGVYNCEVIPNFKRLRIIEDFEENYAEPFKFCTFSRVMKEKGIEDAIQTIQEINKSAGRMICSLDIYGRIDTEYQKKFKKIMNNTTDSVNYRGEVPYDKSVEVLKNYYSLLFPTYWMGEGFPGTIVDAFSAALPVIATDWNCNGEIIKNNVNGILYPNAEIKTLKDAILKIISEHNTICYMKNECVKCAKIYQPEEYVDRICGELLK